MTGGAGFIGSNLADKLIEMGHDVIIVDDLSTGKRSNVNDNTTFYKLDITNNDELSKIFEKEKIDVVNHHAAQVSVSLSVSNPELDKRVNVDGTKNIVDNCNKFGIKKIIFSSSAAVYGDTSELPINEDTSTHPTSPYGKHKLEAEEIIKNSGLNYTIFRYANVYGPRQDVSPESGVISIFCNNMIDEKDIIIHGEGEQTRDFVFVNDVVSANILALESGDRQIFVIGTGVETSINTLFGEIKNILNYQNSAIYKDKRENDIDKSYFNITKAKEMLNWYPEIKLKEGVIKTIEWYKGA